VPLPVSRGTLPNRPMIVLRQFVDLIFPLSLSIQFTSSIPNRPVHPSSDEGGKDYGSQSVFLGVLGRTPPGKVRTGRTIGDYSPSAWTTCTSQVEMMHLQTDSFPFMIHHSCRPRQSPAVPHDSRPSSTFPSRPRIFPPSTPCPELTPLTL